MIYKEINVGGQLRPVSYGFNALAMFQDMTGQPLNELPNIGLKMPMRYMIIFAYVGLKDGARKAKQEFAYTVEDVGDWLDDDADAFIEMFGDFVASQAPAPTADANKKKAGAKSPKS